eukprot:jgi/Hompol1/3592/HPOL_006633-RA
MPDTTIRIQRVNMPPSYLPAAQYDWSVGYCDYSGSLATGSIMASSSTDFLFLVCPTKPGFSLDTPSESVSNKK